MSLFKRCLLGILPGVVLTSQLAAQTSVVTYQGRVQSDGANFNGQGLFKFALVTSVNENEQATATATVSGGFVTVVTPVDLGSGYVSAPVVTLAGGGGSGAKATANMSGGEVVSYTVTSNGSGYTGPPTVLVAPPPDALNFTTRWSNDGTSVDGSEPTLPVAVSVAGGLFTVGLGDARLPSMTALPPDLFGTPNLELRIWFDDGVNGSVVLTPTQSLTAAPYALAVPTATITSEMLSDGAVGEDQLDPSVAVWRTSGGGDAYRQSWVGIQTTNPGAPLSVQGGTDAGLPGGGYLLLGNPNLANVLFDNNEILARNSGAVSTLFLNADGGPVAIGTANTATDYGLRVNGRTNGGAVIVGAANGTSPSVLRVASTTDNGTSLHVLQDSSEPAIVVENDGTGDLISGIGQGGTEVIRVQYDGDIFATDYYGVNVFVDLVDTDELTADVINGVSDRDAKENFEQVDTQVLLEKVAELPITKWNFKGKPNVSHVGPMAQDLYAAFGLGSDEKHIATVDADGVALAAIQGLNQKLEEKEAEIADLQRSNASLEQRLAALEQILGTQDSD